MTLVILESPYAGATIDELSANIVYAKRAVKDSLKLGESPIASHLLYTQIGILDDNIEEDRMRGIAAGLAWVRAADRMILYCDRGLSPGMLAAAKVAIKHSLPVYARWLDVKANLASFGPLAEFLDGVSSCA